MRKARIYDARQLPAYLSPAQYAELMSIDKKTVQKMCRSGLLPAEKVGPRLWRTQSMSSPLTRSPSRWHRTRNWATGSTPFFFS